MYMAGLYIQDAISVRIYDVNKSHERNPERMMIEINTRSELIAVSTPHNAIVKTPW